MMGRAFGNDFSLILHCLFNLQIVQKPYDFVFYRLAPVIVTIKSTWSLYLVVVEVMELGRVVMVVRT